MSTWRPIGVHDVATRIDWNDTSRLTNCDPYLIWADLNSTAIASGAMSFASRCAGREWKSPG